MPPRGPARTACWPLALCSQSSAPLPTLQGTAFPAQVQGHPSQLGAWSCSGLSPFRVPVTLPLMICSCSVRHHGCPSPHCRPCSSSPRCSVPCLSRPVSAVPSAGFCPVTGPLHTCGSFSPSAVVTVFSGLVHVWLEGRAMSRCALVSTVSCPLAECLAHSRSSGGV